MTLAVAAAAHPESTEQIPVVVLTQGRTPAGQSFTLIAHPFRSDLEHQHSSEGPDVCLGMFEPNGGGRGCDAPVGRRRGVTLSTSGDGCSALAVSGQVTGRARRVVVRFRDRRRLAARIFRLRTPLVTTQAVLRGIEVQRDSEQHTLRFARPFAFYLLQVAGDRVVSSVTAIDRAGRTVGEARLRGGSSGCGSRRG